MGSKKSIILIVVCCVFINILSAFMIVMCFLPTFELKGEKEIYLNINSSYNDAGVLAKFQGKDIANEVEVQNNVDVTKPGQYEIVYKLKKGLTNKSLTRKVIVKDLEDPTIELVGDTDIYLAKCEEYQEIGYKAYDNVDGDLTNKVVVTNQDDKIIYEVNDTAQNKFTIERNIIHEDKVAPEITLNEGSTISIIQNSKFVDPGYKAIDNCDVDYTKDVVVTGSVDTSQLGSYKLTYTVKDESGNEAQEERIVKVIKKLNGVIYLTFDDGPGGYTDAILAILAQNNIKATFFVTNQFSKYQGLIKKEYEAGHTVECI